MTSLDPPVLPALASRTKRLADSAIGAVLRLSGAGDVIPLAAGSPAPETFCPKEFTEVTAQLLRGGGSPLQYGDASGLPELRDWIATRNSLELRRPCDAAQVLVTHGSQQGLDLVCKALIDPGDVVVVDRPSYVGALQVFHLFEARVVDVPISSDEHLARLEEVLAAERRVKIIYVVPNFANPTGSSLSDTQRARLAELAQLHGCVIVEDDPYQDLAYETSRQPPPIASLSHTTIRMGSFSKILFPAARTGYLIAPPALTDTLMKFKQAADLGNSQLLQRIVHRLVEDTSFVEAQLEGARELYRHRRDALVAALGNAFDGALAFDVPEGGFFVWATLPGGADATKLLPTAVKEGVTFVPGADFYAHDADRSTLRLSFSCARAQDMPEAVDRLDRAWRSMCTGTL
ncbi:PLP-dependent aminotransferase family protein [Streptomyces sp. NPDC048430]|uniref:aminotransferase-like domain-containing protein n=1 Tax=Streptomyces sp. NPDC048430 TaxID=3155388 RepID=UPI0034336675